MPSRNYDYRRAMKQPTEGRSFSKNHKKRLIVLSVANMTTRDAKKWNSFRLLTLNTGKAHWAIHRTSLTARLFRFLAWQSHPTRRTRSAFPDQVGSGLWNLNGFRISLLPFPRTLYVFCRNMSDEADYSDRFDEGRAEYNQKSAAIFPSVGKMSVVKRCVR